MVIDKIKKINPKEPDQKNERASDMLVGKWVKCNNCKEILYKEELKNNYSICPNCGQYFRLSARRRIKQIIDEGTFNEINENMPLEFSQQPDTLIRILMTYKGLNAPIQVKEQNLEKIERKGFTAVEWGGSEIK